MYARSGRTKFFSHTHITSVGKIEKKKKKISETNHKTIHTKTTNQTVIYNITQFQKLTNTYGEKNRKT